MTDAGPRGVHVCFTGKADAGQGRGGRPNVTRSRHPTARRAWESCSDARAASAYIG